jgi:hypothetical protein
MVLTAKGRYTYVPKFNGNRLLPERERITVEIIRPRVEERNQLHSLDVERDVGWVDEGLTRADSLTFKDRYRIGQILRNHVGDIKNLSVEEDGKTRVIANGTELAESTAFGVANFIQELKAEVLSDRLTEDEKKSTPPPLNLSTRDGPENNGTPSMTTSGNSSVSDTSGGENSSAT